MRARPAVVAVTAFAAAFSLTACGSGTSGKIKANDGSSSSSPSPSVSASTRAGRPTITLPPGYTDDFRQWTGAGTTQTAILQDVADARRALDAAIMHGQNPNDTNVAFYYTGPALSGAKDWIGNYRKNKATITGTMRFDQPKVKIVGRPPWSPTAPTRPTPSTRV